MRIFVLLLLCAAALPTTAAKRPITLVDMDRWRTIQNQQLSRDGAWLAYAVFPQEGDGEFVVRNLKSAVEYKAPAGQRPPALPPADDPEGRPEPRNVTIRFTSDLKHVVFTTFPTRADVLKEKSKAKGGLGIINLATGALTSVPAVKSVQVREQGEAVISYLKDDAAKSDQGSTLVIRTLTSGAEHAISDVFEFSFAKDGKTLAYADSNSVALLNPSHPKPSVIASGKGKYRKLVWDDKQTQLAFFASRERQNKVIVAARATGKATEYGPAGPWPKDFEINERATLTFSKDGDRLFFGTAPRANDQQAPAAKNEDSVSVDLWHWKDNRIQPMQKVRANAERNRTYRAVLHLNDGKLYQLADPTMSDLTLSDDGRWGIGTDDREYRPIAEYDQRYLDSYLVDTRTGERRMLAKKHTGSISWSPDSRHALAFNGRDWLATSVPDGKTVNLTGKLEVKFYNEEHDRADLPPSYGAAGWTKDGKYVLLYDRHDIWQVSPDGVSAVNVTDGVGRRDNLQFRHVRLNPEDRWIDPVQPLLLRAEHLGNRDTGFYRDRLNVSAVPEKIVMAAKSFAAPVKAKEADVLILSAQTYQQHPDLLVTDSSFRELKQVTRANPQQEELLWGSAELVSYRNVDGVPLSGILFKPENFDPTKKYPMVVYLYERLSQTFHTFREPRPTNTINVAMYTSNGYLVLYPDIVYRVGSPGASALKSVLPAVQAVVDKGIVDEKNIGIQGHSWGGYQIAYMLTETNRFKAAAAGAVVANMTSAYNGIRYGPGIPRQFQYERTQSRIGGTLW